jgi:mannose-6-phosphate isomerase-like protein (cupin superfamily)
MAIKTEGILLLRRDQLAPEDGFFQTLGNGPHLQVAVMELADDQVSGPFGTDHRLSDQLVVVLDGTGEVRCGAHTYPLHRGDIVLIAAGMPHQVIGPNRTLNVYGPIAYPEDAD